MALPEIALVSPAARTKATAEIVLDRGAPDARLKFPADLYGADPNDVLIRLSKLGDDVSSAMVVGHNPTTQALAVGLLSPDDKAGRDLVVRRGFPTCALGRPASRHRPLGRDRGAMRRALRPLRPALRRVLKQAQPACLS